MQHDMKVQRQFMGLSQAQVADAVGVSREAYGRWERCERPIPPAYHSRLASVLGIEPSQLPARPRIFDDRPLWLATRHRRHRLPYPTAVTVEDVLRLGGQGRAVVRAARESLSEKDWQALATWFPRDTPSELLLALTLVAFGARPVWESPLRFGCRVLVLDDFRGEYAGDEVQLALLWEHEDETIVVFGQIRLKAIYVKARARVDFLVCRKVRGKRAQWMTVELDGRQHPAQESQDEERAEGLLIPEIRYDNKKMLSENWFYQFLEDVRLGSREGARREADRNKRSDQYRAERMSAITASSRERRLDAA